VNRVLRVRIAGGFLQRARGLLLRPPLGFDEALLLPGCASVHTFGMRYAIDVVFLDPLGRVLRVARALRPWRIASQSGAAAVLELKAGGAAAHQLYPGAVLDAALSGIGELT
jgi:uncharacterized membrane protein (UPF0127 family)